MRLPRRYRHPVIARTAEKLIGALPEPIREPVVVGVLCAAVWSLTAGYAGSQIVHYAANAARRFRGHPKLSRFDVLHTKKYLHHLQDRERLH